MAAKKNNGKKNETKAVALIPNYAMMQHDVKDLMAIIGANLGAHEQLTPGDLDRIKIPAGGGTTWSIPTLDGEIDTKEFEGVIVAFKNQRAYWEESFSGGNVPPDCSSDDGMTGTGEPGGDCGKCRWSQFESATGEDGKPRPGQACKQVRLMAIVMKDDLIPILIAAPPTSLGNMRRYFLRLSSRAVPFYGVLTKFTLIKAKSQGGIEYSQLACASAGKLSPDETVKMKAYAEVIGSSLERRSAANAEDYTEE
jgi:hypothetical protein